MGRDRQNAGRKMRQKELIVAKSNFHRREGGLSGISVVIFDAPLFKNLSLCPLPLPLPTPRNLFVNTNGTILNWEPGLSRSSAPSSITRPQVEEQTDWRDSHTFNGIVLQRWGADHRQEDK
ncbi:hypothetical protein F5880DRAFT_1618000 [Lentinula raphanica]|nr:hypothetical protein F5880DRAFT_1618000 [Lentinula raphanica]